MARTPRGNEVLEKAKGLLPKARTIEELRMLQAFILPLEFGFSMERTAAITGVSKRMGISPENAVYSEWISIRQKASPGW